MKYALILLMLSVGYTQVTLTQEQADNIAKNIQELQIKADSLSIQDSLKTLEIDLLNKKITMLEEDLAITEKKAKLVKSSWYENKWLYFGYGATLSYAVLTLANKTGNIADLFK